LATSPNLSRSEDLALREAASGRSRTKLLANDLQLFPAEQALYDRLLIRRLRGEPFSYLLGFKEFYGRRFWVNSCCLIPRPETETLVDLGLRWALELNEPCSPSGCEDGKERATPIRLLDLGTGSGCLAISLCLELQARGFETECFATDLSEDALRLARNNAAWLGADVQFLQGSWMNALPEVEKGKGFDLIVSNPPYVGSEDWEFASGSLSWEPKTALVGHAPSKDGMNDLREIAGQAIHELRPNGLLALEHGYRQQELVVDCFQQAGFSEITPMNDLASRPRYVLGRL
jgi:release factor glutamine methyltransferase